MEEFKTIINRFGEKQTTWTSHKHPNNPNFMQIVRYMHIEKQDGRTTLYWSLFNASVNDNHYIPNISLRDAQEKYCDNIVKELSEDDFKQWLKEKHNYEYEGDRK